MPPRAWGSIYRLGMWGGGGGGGTNRGNFGTGVKASISKPTPFIYLAFEKTESGMFRPQTVSSP